LSQITFFQHEIRQHWLFKDMPDESFQNVMQFSGLLSLKKCQELFKSDFEANHFYLVRSGQMVLFQVSVEGKEKVVDIYESGEVFAETALFSNDKYYSFNARAALNTELFYIDVQTFKIQLKQSTDLCFSMMSELSRRLKMKTHEIIELSIYNAQYRLVNYLLRKCCKKSDQSCQPIVILSTTKALLASRLSITSETFSRTLSHLKKLGLITIKDETIILNDPQKLRALIGHYESNLLEIEKIRS
jgi:CRP/FNR family transcriptional regulator, dissimilatory nitrate respiration regulator